MNAVVSDVRHRIFLWFKIAVAIGIVAYLVESIDWPLTLNHFGRADRLLVFVAGLLLVAGYLVSSLKWQVLLAAQGIDIPLRELFKNYWIGSFANNFLPSSFGGDVVRLSLLTGRNRVEMLAASIFLERLTGFLVLLVYAAIALCLWRPTMFFHEKTLFGCLVIVVFLVILFVCWNFPRLKLLTMRFRIFQIFVESLEKYKSKRRSIYISFIISFIFYVLVVLIHYVFLMSLGVSLDIYQVVLVVPFVNLIGIIPLTLNGIGLVEGATILLYCQFGPSQEEIFAVAVVIRVTQMITSLPGGYLLFFGNQSRKGS